MQTKPLILLICLAFVGSQTTDKVPTISISGDKSAGPGDIGSSKDDIMQSLLNWGIEHSDPEKLKELMEKYKEQNLTIKDVYGEDVLNALFVNEGEVMQKMTDQISDFANASITDDDLEASLESLLELVEQVDNAGNLHRMGALQPLLDLAILDNSEGNTRRSESVRMMALWTLGVAVQNNAPVQNDVFSLGGLTSLLGKLPVCESRKSEESDSIAGQGYCGKLVFAISALVRNNETIQTIAESEGLFDWLLDHGIQHQWTSIAKKAMSLLDIVLSQNSNLQFLNNLSAKRDAVANAILKLVRGSDADISEKAAQLVNRLVSLRPLLFRETFKSEFSNAMAEAIRQCEATLDSEMCQELKDLARSTESALDAREVSDDEL